MIFYLSCTGNTLWAARQLSDATNEQMISIPEAVKGNCEYHLHEAERIGICFPIHGWKLQRMIVEFIDKLKIQTTSKTYIYVVCTCGDSCGEVLEQIEEKLKAKGWRLSLKTALIMPESYIGLPFMDVDTDLREAEKKSLASMELHKISELVLFRRSQQLKYNKGYSPFIYSRIIGPFFHKHLITDKRFHVDASKCIGCGKCAKVCPVMDIMMVARNGDQQTPPSVEVVRGLIPQWQHNGDCLTCFSCYHHCPERAIDFWHFTKGKGQYYFDKHRKR